MARPIANVNGKAVYSDKNMTSIVNTRITFSDGSWCDVSTGEVVNKGSGYISIGAPANEGNNEKTKLGPKTYQATTLEVQGVEADVTVQPIKGSEMTVVVEGTKSSVENVDVHTQGDTLVVRGKDTGGTNIRGANVVISGGNISVGGGGISIGGMRGGRIVTGNSTVVISGSDESDTKITISVPAGSAVKVAGVQGNVVIGDTEGVLHASVLGGSDIKAGKVRDATLSVQGGGDITVASVTGNLSMNVQGSGDIRVRGGKVNLLNINVMGSGDARFNGEATDANLTVMGSGDIDVDSVKNRPNKNVMGHGDINVGNW
jgi:hypothetical protein